MVFYLLVTAVQDSGAQASASSGACPGPKPASPDSEREEPRSAGACVTSAPVQVSEDALVTVRLFRASGSAVGSAAMRAAGSSADAPSGWRSRGLLEDALPIQRTTEILLLAVPSEVSLGALQVFLEDSWSEVEALRALNRGSAAAAYGLALPESGSEGGMAAGDFYSAIISCRSQAGADAVYKANHGRFFDMRSRLASLGPEDQPAGSGGPCCYLVFLEKTAEASCSSFAAAVTDPPPAEEVPLSAYEVPACPFCLERLDVSGTGVVTHSHGWLSAMARGHVPYTACCTACAVVARYMFSAVDGECSLCSPVCACCEKQEEIWVCLICGHTGCGRYALGHAKDHALDRQHRFCLELATGRIWDYLGDVFVHRRLVQMAAASGGFFDLTLPAPAAEGEVAGEGSKQVTRSEDPLAVELDAILASQLDYQRSLYETKLSDLDDRHKRALATNHRSLEAELARQDEIHANITEVERRRKLLDKQQAVARKAKEEAEDQLRFVKDLNQSLLANRREMATPASAAPIPGGPAGAEGATVSDEEDTLVKRLRERVERLMSSISTLEGEAPHSGPAPPSAALGETSQPP